MDKEGHKKSPAVKQGFTADRVFINEPVNTRYVKDYCLEVVVCTDGYSRPVNVEINTIIKIEMVELVAHLEIKA